MMDEYLKGSNCQQKQHFLDSEPIIQTQMRGMQILRSTR